MNRGSPGQKAWSGETRFIASGKVKSSGETRFIASGMKESWLSKPIDIFRSATINRVQNNDEIPSDIV
ncbi:MAG: hypothetical protein C0593_09820 [Marinilabiliales bacterium]|nr:MAG: hypothetical protein C0593_09820 [Marinilabiliales bacterium]